MNSEWFLFKGTHHIGPFTSQEIELMYKKGEIVASVLIWKEGVAKWEQLKNVAQFNYLFHVEALSLPSIPDSGPKTNEVIEELPDVPEVPPIVKTANKKLPQAPHKPQLIAESALKVEKEEDLDLPPPLPMDVFSTQPESQTIGPQASNLKLKFEGHNKSDYSKWFFYVFGIFFAAIFIWRFGIQPKSEIHFKIRELMPINLEKLESTASIISSETKISMALSMDGRKIYISSNTDGELDLNIKLISVPNKILGNETATVFLRGKAFEHLGDFDRVILTSGKPFVPGFYKYSANVVEKHFINAYFPVLSSISFFKNLNQKYTLKGEELIYAGSPKEFKDKLKKFNDEIFDQKTRPLQDKLERINTIQALLDQLKTHFEQVLLVSKSGKQMKEFEDYYVKEVAPVLQSMIVVDPNDPKNFNEVIKKVGGLVADELNKTLKLKKITPNDVKIHSEVFLKNRDVISEEMDIARRKIQEDIKNTPR